MSQEKPNLIPEDIPANFNPETGERTPGLHNDSDEILEDERKLAQEKQEAEAERLKRIREKFKIV